MALVKFNEDVTPYCVGDVVNLSKEEAERVDEVAKRRKLKNVYETHKPTDEELVRAGKKKAPADK